MGKVIGELTMKTLRNSALIAAMLLVVQMTLGQDKPQITKPIDEKPISQYMRGVMILYLEDIQNFKDECKDGETCHRVLGDVNDGEWDKTLDSLEDRIKINIHEPGDKIEQKLLENVRYAENAYLE